MDCTATSASDSVRALLERYTSRTLAMYTRMIRGRTVNSSLFFRESLASMANSCSGRPVAHP
ncbi:hypothetical protein D3C77_793150 [compost metagenome]